MANPVVSWAKENPVLAGGIAVGVVLIVLLFTSGGEQEADSASGGMGAAGVQAYYAAVARQSQAGAAIQVAQIQSQAETNQALIAATYSLETNRVNAQSDQYIATLQRDVAMRGFDVDLQNNMGWATVYREVELNRVNQEANWRANAINLADAALRTKKLDTAQRGAIVQAAITGQSTPVIYKPINPGNSVGGILGGIAKALPFI